MRKNIFKFFTIALVIITFIVIIILIDNDINMNSALGVRVPLLTKREKIELQDRDFFNTERVIKIYLSKNQAKHMIKKLKRIQIGEIQS